MTFLSVLSHRIFVLQSSSTAKSAEGAILGFNLSLSL